MAPAKALSRRRVVAGALAAAGGAAAWTVVSAVASGGDPLPMAAVIVASAAAFSFGAATGAVKAWIVPAIIVGAAALVAIASRADIASARPTHGPFGYSNATGAFYVQAAAAGLMLAASVGRRMRWAGWASAAGAAVIATAAGSTAAAVGLVVVAAAAVLSGTGSRRAATTGVAAAFALVLAGTIVVAAFSGTFTGEVPGDGIFDQTRKTLWHEAVTTLTEHPLTGVGPGRFSEASPLARDADTRRAHHGFLQVGAETGVVGMGLVVGAFVWLLASFASQRDPAPSIVIGAAALAAFGIGACVDYLMHFPAIPVTAAALAGTATIQLDA